MNSKVKIAITMGDPAGIGAEIILKSLCKVDVYKKTCPIVYGDKDVLEDMLRICKLPLKLREITSVEEAEGRFGVVDYINLDLVHKGEWNYKENMSNCGMASFQYVKRAIEDAMSGKLMTVVTAPINKKSLRMAGLPYDGHTEIFAELTGTKDFAMLLASKYLHVIHVSTHCSLREACDRVKEQRVYDVIKLAQRGMMELGYENPKIAVAGLNPHASEDGLFGHEEENEIIPAINRARCEGIDVEGPVPPDTVFVKCQAGQYDIVVAMYHDQGHIPLKLSGFKYDHVHNKYDSVSGINCTIGLPIIRTSVDHGTAFGKAGEGRANEESMLDAIMAGVKMTENRKRQLYD